MWTNADVVLFMLTFALIGALTIGALGSVVMRWLD